MKNKVLRILVLAVAPCIGAAGLAARQTEPPSQAKPTADQAKNNLSDRDTMQKIRKSLVDDKSLSSYAHNVKVIAQNGKVTLRGPVRSEEEKKIVEQKATDVAGADNVVSEITIQPSQK